MRNRCVEFKLSFFAHRKNFFSAFGRNFRKRFCPHNLRIVCCYVYVCGSFAGVWTKTIRACDFLRHNAVVYGFFALFCFLGLRRKQKIHQYRQMRRYLYAYFYGMHIRDFCNVFSGSGMGQSYADVQNSRKQNFRFFAWNGLFVCGALLAFDVYGTLQI